MNAANIKHSESYFKGHDNHRLYYQSFQVNRSKGVLIFVHGFGEHSGRYEFPVRYFIAKGYTVYLYDHRGHGKSDGLRSYVESFKELVDDLKSFVSFVEKKESSKPIFLIGHSMGGQIVLNYLGSFKTPVKGFITSSANIQMAVKIPWLKKKIGLGLSSLIPKFAITNEIDPALICTDKEVVRNYKRDNLVSKKITLKMAFELISNVDTILSFAPKIKLPALMLHGGDDKICAKEGTEEFFNRLASPDKKMIIYPGCYHEIFNEKIKDKVFSDMLSWLEDRNK